MAKVVAVVGYSNSGKTRVATELVKALTAMGFSIAAVKHCHDGHQMDRPDSDTDRLYKAGAVTVMASSPGRLTTMSHVDGDAPLEDILSGLGRGIDLVIAEGFKHSSVPKVVVTNGGSPPPEGLHKVIASVGNGESCYKSPRYGFGEVEALADMIRERFLEIQPPNTNSA